MTPSNALKDIIIRPEINADDVFIEALGAEAFGPGRFSRSAFRLREGVSCDPRLSFVATIDEKIVGSVRLTPILIGKKKALVLGPLMISPDFRNYGIGRELMNRSLIEARKAGNRFVVLVGDYAYYRLFGFNQLPVGQITFPGPADPARILGCELVPGVAKEFHGETKRDFSRR